MKKTRVAINGAAGRMGRRLVALASADAELELVGALEHARHSDLGQDAGPIAGVAPVGVALSAEFPSQADSAIDFSVPAAAEAIVATCRRSRVPLVLATTGLSDQQKQQVRDAAREIPIVCAPNMSLAVNLTMKLVEIAARALRDNPAGADVEILERHHRYKEDAPSGTALKFGEIVAAAMGQTEHVHGREGLTGKRTRAEIGYHAIRVGDNPGEHTIVFGLLGETIELTVRATSRDCYALGALAAAKWIVGKEPGMYSMFDVLGI